MKNLKKEKEKKVDQKKLDDQKKLKKEIIEKNKKVLK